jgi:beta-xylosidase
MTRIDRRTALTALGAVGGVLTSSPSNARANGTPQTCAPELAWPRGIEGQRRADLGNGRFLNPVLAGDYADPSILRDGADYYLVCSSFDAVPGLVIWHSRDLVNWQPRIAALRTPVGSVWAPELCKFNDRFFIYFHARTPSTRDIYAIHATSIDGPWSDPVPLGLPKHIDPGHAVGEDGERYLFLSGGDHVRLSADGLVVTSPVEHVYDPWRYPDDWDVESFSPEGPKILRRDGWYYLVTAVGGTAGPPTGHMVIAARSRSVHGPWEHAPNNPIVRTRSASEPWWSRGHATLITAPDESWWMMYHGYERGFWTLGRQTLLDPIAWRQDGWFEARGGDLGKPLRIPNASPVHKASNDRPVHGIALSDDFATDRLGLTWRFYDPTPQERDRLSRGERVLTVRGKGSTPADASPLCLVAGDHAYSLEIDIEREGAACAGILLFYSRRLYCGLGFDSTGFVMHRYGTERRSAAPAGLGKRVRLRITNNRHIVSIHYSLDGTRWTRFGVQMEVSGYHHNVAGDFLSLRPAIYVAGDGAAHFRNARYTALEGPRSAT